MYYPYLRGRQFELIALRELAENGLLGKRICPVIEPVKATSTLLNTLNTFKRNDMECAIVMNSEIGDFARILQEENNEIIRRIKDQISSDGITEAYILNQETKASLKGKEHDYLGKVMTISTSQDGLDVHNQIFKRVSPSISLIPDGNRMRRALTEDKVIFKDYFNKAERNADYLKREDEFFSDDHIYYAEEGYQGFADYSVIGAEYNESGFAPLAVAIHVVYFGKDDTLRIHHFVSDSNDDINDPAGKFGEAVKKLFDWVENKDIRRTYGLNALSNCFLEGKYPGLGTVKKYTIMHHLELMSNYLEGVSNVYK